VANVHSGHLRVLAVLDERRSEVFPGAPTARELGYPIGAPAWSAFSGPKGIPEDQLRRLEAAFRDGTETAAWKKLCAERGMEAVFLDRAEFGEFAMQQAQFFSAEIPNLLGGDDQARAPLHIAAGIAAGDPSSTRQRGVHASMRTRPQPQRESGAAIFSPFYRLSAND
jgi:hypothetical protein